LSAYLESVLRFEPDGHFCGSKDFARAKPLLRVKPTTAASRQRLAASKSTSAASPPYLRITVGDVRSSSTSCYIWRPGDTIPLGGRSLRVVAVREQGEDEPRVLAVEDVATA
jgi:hypothetical protein